MQIAFTPMLAALMRRLGGLLPTRPPVRGARKVPGLHTDVAVSYTDGGIPHIAAQSAQDLFFAQGFLTAADRLFQLDLFRRTARGEMAEIVGERPAPWRELTAVFRGWTMVDVDHFMRQLSLPATARESVDMLSPEAKALTDAYAAGVNAWMDSGPNPIECQLLNYRPRPWTAVDSALVWKLMGFQLSYGWRAGLAAEAMRARFPGDAARARAILPDQREVADVMLPVWPGAADLLSRANAVAGPGNVAGTGLGGSNGWAIAPSRTRNGRAILCGDPHLPMRAPSAGYLIHLSGGGFDVAGWSLPGVPGVAMGHNSDIAWTLTSGCTLDATWALEQLSTDGLRARTSTGFADIETEQTEILVRGKKPVRRVVRHTRNGPLFDTQLAGEGPPGYALALRWTGHLATPDLEAVFALDRARDFETFRQSASRISAPPMNGIYADTQGHIGWQFIGATPRFKAQPPRGAVPGWSDEHEWDGIEHFDSLPHLLDPPDGLIVSANQRLLPTDSRVQLGELFEPPYRARRIRRRLESEPSISVQAAQVIQLDLFSGFGADLRDRFLKGLAERQRQSGTLTAEQESVLTAAVAWNGFATPESAGAAAAWAFAAALIPELFEKLLGDRVFHAVFEQHNLTMLPLLAILERGGAPYFSSAELDSASLRALDTAHAKLVDACGAEPSAWRLSAFRTVAMRHPLSDVPGLGRLFTVGPIPWAGDGSTVNCSSFALDRGQAAEVGPCFRHAVECGDWDRYRVIMATGEGGDPANGRYREMFSRWRSGQLVTLPFSRESIVQAATDSAVLRA